MHVSSPDQIQDVLDKAHQCINEKQVTFHPRRKEMDTLARLGMRGSDIWDVISKLKVENYHRGPVVDYTHANREWWIFCAEIGATELYIKFRISDKDGYLIVMSFHIPEGPMRMPYAKGRGGV